MDMDAVWDDSSFVKADVLGVFVTRFLPLHFLLHSSKSAAWSVLRTAGASTGLAGKRAYNAV